MSGGMFLLSMILVFVAIFGWFCVPLIRTAKKDRTHTPRKALDKAGVITNIVLGVLYIPLSLFGSLFGMVGEGYMNDPSLWRAVLCDVIMILGIYTPLVSIGSIVTSVLLRKRGCSVLSFGVQFSALVHLAIMGVLAALL